MNEEEKIVNKIEQLNSISDLTSLKNQLKQEEMNNVMLSQTSQIPNQVQPMPNPEMQAQETNNNVVSYQTMQTPTQKQEQNQVQSIPVSQVTNLEQQSTELSTQQQSATSPDQLVSPAITQSMPATSSSIGIAKTLLPPGVKPRKKLNNPNGFVTTLIISLLAGMGIGIVLATFYIYNGLGHVIFTV